MTRSRVDLLTDEDVRAIQDEEWPHEDSDSAEMRELVRRMRTLPTKKYRELLKNRERRRVQGNA